MGAPDRSDYRLGLVKAVSHIGCNVIHPYRSVSCAYRNLIRLVVDVVQALLQRLQKTLEEANIKIESVLSDVMGRSGRAMIQALIDGESDPAKLAALALEGACVGSNPARSVAWTH